MQVYRFRLVETNGRRAAPWGACGEHCGRVSQARA